MAVINLRGVPDNLAAQLKSEAALAGVGYHEYCVVILSNRGSIGLTLAKVEESRKKIADISVGSGATEGGGDPCLPRGGKAQDGHFETKFVDTMLENIRESGRRRELSDGVPCGHAGCLSHISHPCEGCGRIGGRRPIYNMEDNAAAGRPRTITGKWPEWSEARWRELAEAEPGGLMACSPELLTELKEAAKTDAGVAATLILAGVKLEGQDGIKGSGEAGQDKRTAGGDFKPVAEGDHGAQKPAVGVGKPEVNMKALRDICEGNLQPFAFAGDIPDEMKLPPDLGEVDLCGFKSYNETDGEWYVCAKEKHGVKVKHGEWLKV